MEPISIGLTALSVGSSLFGMFGQKSSVDPNRSMMSGLLAAQASNQANEYADRFNQLSLAENGIRRQQMNLDAERRKRDVIRNAQVAHANATAVGYNQGAGNSSALSGATSGIAGQAATMTKGIADNQELGNNLFDNLNQQAAAKMDYQKSQNAMNFASSMLGIGGGSSNSGARAATMFGNIVSNNQEDLTKLFKFGISKI